MVLGWLWPFGRKSKHRRERFRNWESVPQDYGQSLVTHIIASKTGRSTHTVRSVLTQRGTRPLPERDTEPIDEESAVARVALAGGGGAENGTTPVP